jgi:hypothetical protein
MNGSWVRCWIVRWYSAAPFSEAEYVSHKAPQEVLRFREKVSFSVNIKFWGCEMNRNAVLSEPE